jgi:selenide,water dikinase
MQSGHLVLVGGGHSHLFVFEDLARQSIAGLRVTVVVDRPRAVYSGMVPGYVAGMYRADELELDVPTWAERCGADLVQQPATAVDPLARRVTLADGSSVEYDLCSLDVGSTVAGLDAPGVREHALATRPIGEFVAQVDARLERAVAAADSTSAFPVVIVGAGAGGIELAFCLRARAAAAGATADVTVLCSDRGILPGSPPALIRRVEREARRAGITLRCGARADAVAADHVVLGDGQTLPSALTVWVTGAAPHPNFHDPALPLSGRGFVRTRPTLQAVGHDTLFGAGDCIELVEHPRTPKAGVYAVRQGPLLAANLRATLTGEPLQDYTPQSDFLALLNLGDGRALGSKWGRSFGGRWVMKLKDRIDRAFMKRFH